MSSAGCEALQAETDGYCVTNTGDGLELVGLSTGSMCALASTDVWADPFYNASLAWRGEFLYTCGADGLLRISLVGGTFEAIGLACQAVTDFAGGILRMTPVWGSIGSQYRWYESRQSLLENRVDRFYPGPMINSRMTASGSTLLTAWHSTGVIERYDLVTGESLSPIALEGYDDWIFGFAVTPRNELVVSDGIKIVVFEGDTGRRLRELPGPRPAIGLACTGPSEVRGARNQRPPVVRRRLATMPRSVVLGRR